MLLARDSKPSKSKPADDSAPSDETDSSPSEDGEDDLDDLGEDEEDLEDNSEDEDVDQDDEDADEGEDDDSDEDEPKDKKTDLSDDATVEITVHGKTETLTIAQLKRIAADRTAIQAKSEEADKVGRTAAAAIDAVASQLQEDLVPYLKADWDQMKFDVLNGRMSEEEYNWHKQNFTKLQARWDKLKNAESGYVSVMDEATKARRAQEAQEAVAELKRDIPEWDDKLYTDVVNWSATQGLNPEEVLQITNAKVMKILVKAFRADTKKTAAVKKIENDPRPLKPSASGDSPVNANIRKLEKKIKSGAGTEEDAIALLKGRWG